MSREWDTSLKLLFGEKPQDFISWLYFRIAGIDLFTCILCFYR